MGPAITFDMLSPILYLVIAGLILAIVGGIIKILLQSKKKASKSTPPSSKDNAALEYKLKPFLMTKNELNFYKALLPVAESKNFAVFSKVRIADLLEPREGSNWNVAFNRIKAKHVDFVLCDKAHIRPRVVIELDDKTHQRADRDARDTFVDSAFASAGLPIIHTLSSVGLSEKIDAATRRPAPTKVTANTKSSPS